MKITNSIRITKKGQERLNELLNSFIVNDYHKTLLKGIKNNIPKKNVSKSDCEIFETINKQYEGRGIR